MMVKVAVPEKFKLRIVPNVRTVLFGGQQEDYQLILNCKVQML